MPEVEAFSRSAPTRMPFKFGAVTMTSLSAIYLRARVELEDGRSARGVGASVLSPMWFDKSPDKSYEQKLHALLLSMRLAGDGYRDAGTGGAYRLHRVVEPEVHDQCRQRGIKPLPASFGIALVDGAIVDALCRIFEVPFHVALREDLFGFGPVPGLPARPSPSLHIRHTVGLADPLVGQDVADLDDGLPETLEQVIREYGHRYFKIKIASDVAGNLDRLRAIADVLAVQCQGDYAVVMDGNEQFGDMRLFLEFFEAFRSDTRLSALWDRTLWFEQPVERDAALADAAAAVLAQTREHKPVILDESDGSDDVVERGLALGYGGVSAKNCKGVFRTLHSARVLDAWRTEHQHPAILSGEDLTNPGVLPLHQDTAVVAALGIEHVERNGHHYVRGLDHLAPAEQEAALREFPSLYERLPNGLVRLAIRGGRIPTHEITASGYGGAFELDVGGLDKVVLPEAPA